MSRKLDAAIAEALGKELVWIEIIKDYKVNRYSTDGNAMLELDKEMRARGWYKSICSLGKYNRVYYIKQWVDDNGEHVKRVASRIVAEIPEAVALAAYEALTGEEWEDG